ncbi:hypothetical protein WG906_01645 [Pedobacter sp. P351]|uniref:hypothetical protein n=1 Tax=Pedobacter superstes TaxID=3133441 RepID=UPI0030AA1387
MKKTKPKSTKPAKAVAKASPKKTAKKELESGIAERFLDVVSNLGHDAERIAKDIKKMSKEIAKKLFDKVKSANEAEKISIRKKIKANKEIAKREVKATRKEGVKAPTRAEKVVAKVASKPAAKPSAKRTPQITSSNAIVEPKPGVRRQAGSEGSNQAETEPLKKRIRKPAAPKPVLTETPVSVEESNVTKENQIRQESSETKSE